MHSLSEAGRSPHITDGTLVPHSGFLLTWRLRCQRYLCVRTSGTRCLPAGGAALRADRPRHRLHRGRQRLRADRRLDTRPGPGRRPLAGAIAPHTGSPRHAVLPSRRDLRASLSIATDLVFRSTATLGQLYELLVGNILRLR